MTNENIDFEFDVNDFVTEYRGGGDSPVQSVNGKIGNVVLTASDVHALPDSTVIPSLDGYATQAWVSGQGYLTQHQDLSGKADKSEIPTKTSDLTNDSGFLTSHQDISGKADKTTVNALDTRVTALENAQASGLSDTAIDLLLTILRAGVTTSDMTSTIDDLEEELTGETPTPVVRHTVAWSGSNYSKGNSATSVVDGSSYTSTITADSGYTIDSVTVTMGGSVVSGAYLGGTVTIASVTGDVSISVVTSQIAPVVTTYTVTNSLTNCTTSNNATSVNEGDSYTATITADSGYTLDSVTCTMGGVSQTVTGGVISIASVTGNIVITASATGGVQPSVVASGDLFGTDNSTVIGSWSLDANGVLTLTQDAGYAGQSYDHTSAENYPFYQYESQILSVHNVNCTLKFAQSMFDGYNNLTSFVSDIDIDIPNRFLRNCTALTTDDFRFVKNIGSSGLSHVGSLNPVFAKCTSFGAGVCEFDRAVTVTILNIPTTIQNWSINASTVTDAYVAWAESDSINANNPFGLKNNPTFHYNYTEA